MENIDSSIIDDQMCIVDIYLYLLRCAIWDCPLEMDMHGTNWKMLLTLSNRHGTTPLICDQLLKLDESQGINDALRVYLRNIAMQNMLAQRCMEDILNRAWTALEQKGLSPVLLKGFGLAQLYPLPYLRQWGDADIYIGPQYYHEGCAALREAFPNAKHHDEEWEELKHYNFVMPEGVIELHRTAMKYELSRDFANYLKMESLAMSKANTQHLVVDGTMFRIPEARFNLLYVFAHAWEHFVESGIGMKQVADVALLTKVSYSKLNRVEKEHYNNYLRKNLELLHLLEPWRIFGVLIVKSLCLPQDDWPLYDDSKSIQRRGLKLYERVIQEGLIREKPDRETIRKEGRNLPWLKRKIYTYRSRMSVVKHVFPYSPRYAFHLWWTILVKGIKRTLRNEGMIEY